MMRALKRFFVSSSLASTGTILLPREETHHLRHVLRMNEGELCLLFDSEGREFISRIEHYRKDASAELKLMEPVSSPEMGMWQAMSLQLTVAQAIPQDRKMDEMVRQAAELGVYQIIPLITERTIVRIPEGKSTKVIERWQRIASQTLKQSRLNRAPQIQPLMTFDVLCQNLKSYQNKLILDPSSDALPIKDYGSQKMNDLLLIVGPEGGFSTGEIEQAEHLGAKRIRLGGGILKTDTAFVAAAAFFKLINE